MPLRRSAVQVRAFGKRVAAALDPLPPLAELVYVGVVPSHFVAEAPNPSIVTPDAQAQLRLLAGYQRLPKAAESGEHAGTKHRNATARFNLTCRSIPLDVAKSVVNGALGKSFAQAATHAGHVDIHVQMTSRSLQPIRTQLTVAIDELHV
ncbi:MAG TPA: hypothetical protein VIM34_10650 [Burkholderiaceae bacterium]